MDAGRQLLHRYLDEIASAADLAELARLLPQRPDLADDLAEAVRTEALLECHFSERRAQTAVAAVLVQSGPPLRGGCSEPTARHGVAGRVKWCAAAVLLAATSVLLGFWLGRSQPDRGAVVSGRVRIGGVEVVHVPDDSSIEVVGQDAAVIRLPDGSCAELAPASSAVLRQHVRGARKVVELDRGGAVFHVEKGRKRFHVNTPLGSVSTLDAEFCVELQTEEDEGEEPLNRRNVILIVAALVGQVEVDSGGKHYVLAAGQKQSFADKSYKKPTFSGTIVEASAGMLIVESPPAKKGGEPTRREFKYTPKTEFVYFGVSKEEEKPTVGYLASVWLAEGSNDTLVRVQLGLKHRIIEGKVAAVATDAKSFTLEMPGKAGTPVQTELKLLDGIKVVYQDADKGDRPTVGYFARVWLKPGTQDAASGVVFSSKKIADASGKGKKGTKAPLAGTVKALSTDGKSFTLALPKTKKGDEPAPINIRITGQTKINAGKEAGKLAVGQVVTVWLEEGSEKDATTVQIGKLEEKPVKKPAAAKKTALVGTVKALSADGKSFTLALPKTKKGEEPAPIDIRLTDLTKITTGKEAGKLAVGQPVTVWLDKGAANSAETVQIGKPDQPDKPKPDKVKKPATDANEKKPDGSKKPREPAKPARDPAPTAAVIDTEIDRRLAADKVPASPQADDAEFLRRVTLDLTGRIPTYRQTVTFLASNDPGKRRKIVDELLDSPAYGEHFATIWRNLIVARNNGAKAPRDTFTPWLAEQFNDNRGWNAIVADLLTAEGPVNDNPAAAFLLANAENFQPQPGMVAGAAANLFWGVNLRCRRMSRAPIRAMEAKRFLGHGRLLRQAPLHRLQRRAVGPDGGGLRRCLGQGQEGPGSAVGGVRQRHRGPCGSG